MINISAQQPNKNPNKYIDIKYTIFFFSFSFTEEEIDVVSVGDKLLPTNPATAMNSSALQSVVRKIATTQAQFHPQQQQQQQQLRMMPQQQQQYQQQFVQQQQQPMQVIKTMVQRRRVVVQQPQQQQQNGTIIVQQQQQQRPVIFGKFALVPNNANNVRQQQQPQQFQLQQQFVGANNKSVYTNATTVAAATAAANARKRLQNVQNIGGPQAAVVKRMRTINMPAGIITPHTTISHNGQLFNNSNMQTVTPMPIMTTKPTATATTKKSQAKQRRNNSAAANSAHAMLNNNNGMLLPPIATSSATNAAELDESDTIEKRNLHNNMERQRRIGLKNLFDELKQQLPSLAEKERAPKVTILREAAQLCTRLHADDLERQRLEQNQENLMRRVRELRMQLAGRR